MDDSISALNRKLRTIIVDDEKYARNDLKELLTDFPLVEVVGEAKNINDAISLISQHNPDLIFLDIQFPGENGFDLFNKIETSAKIIFVTAFNEYAIRAFEVNACDYLLKPVHPARLKKSIDRLQYNKNEIKPLNSTFNNEDLIYIQLNYKYYFVRMGSIICIKAFDHFTEIITNTGLKGLTNKCLYEWEECLPKDSFLKIHRSTIINKHLVERIDRGQNYSFLVKMKCIDYGIPISRRYAKQIKADLEF